jgi:ketosteroid isomerase-like protein
MQTEIQDPTTEATLAAIDRFNEAFNRRDVDAIMRLMSQDCVFESTSPAPDGGRYVGQAEVRAVWEELFGSSPDAHFDAEEIIATGDLCVVRWRYTFGTAHVRGVDLMRVRGGQVTEKLSYVKG